MGNETTDRFTAPCQLFRNDGDGTFTDVAAAAGVENGGYTKGVTWGDFDGDRYPDLYVSNLAGPNRLYRNTADGRFTDVAPQLGVTEPTRGFPVWFWDFNNDGALDIFAASYAGRIGILAAHYAGTRATVGLPRLYQGDGRGGFRDVATALHLTTPLLPMGSNYGDLDGDGRLDFYLGTGDPEFQSLMPNLMYVQRAGAGFVDVSTAGGFAHLQKGHAVAFADLDHDGDLDVFQQMGAPFEATPTGTRSTRTPGLAAAGSPWTWSACGRIDLPSARGSRSTSPKGRPPGPSTDM